MEPEFKAPKTGESRHFLILRVSHNFFSRFFAKKKQEKKQEKQETFPKFGNLTEGKNIWDASHANIFFGGEMDSMERKYNTRTVRTKNCAKTISGKLK